MEIRGPDFITFFQKPSPPGQPSRIKYITSDMEEPATMEYYKFIVFLQSLFHVEDFFNMREKLDSFKTILVIKGENSKSTWEEQPEPEVVWKQANLEELLEYNENQLDMTDSKMDEIFHSELSVMRELRTRKMQDQAVERGRMRNERKAKKGSVLDTRKRFTFLT